MQKKLILNAKDSYNFTLVIVVFSIFFMLFMTYSIGKFSVLSSKSLNKEDIVMKVIQHSVKSVCPKCGFKGVPMCPQCSVDMYWNGYRGTFLCPSCGHGGFPQCSRCGTLMTWIAGI